LNERILSEDLIEAINCISWKPFWANKTFLLMEAINSVSNNILLFAK
jgi:hypothetical protein